MCKLELEELANVPATDLECLGTMEADPSHFINRDIALFIFSHASHIAEGKLLREVVFSPQQAKPRPRNLVPEKNQQKAPQSRGFSLVRLRSKPSVQMALNKYKVTLMNFWLILICQDLCVVNHDAAGQRQSAN
jgi:hypothetical protein